MRFASDVAAIWLAAPGRWLTARRRSTPLPPKWWPLGRAGDCLLACLLLWRLLSATVQSSLDRGRESVTPAPLPRHRAELLDGLEVVERVGVIVAWRESCDEAGVRGAGARLATREVKRSTVAARERRGRSAKAGLGASRCC